jgi:predicted acylesterase/phospholipase RssA
MAEQYRADGVFQGGGVKGLGLVGALLQFAEDARVQINEWVNVAGTSAGSIVASLIATEKSPADLEALFLDLDYTQFEDWGSGGEIIGGGLNLARHHGLARGEVFHTWIDTKLDHRTFGSVRILTPEQKQGLLQSGRAGAKAFLDDYDPAKYMNTFGQPLAQ